MVVEAGSRWTVLGAPLDSSGNDRGEAAAPQALRAAGLVEGLGANDAGDISTRITTPQRDPGSGLIGFADVCHASAELGEEVGRALDDRRRALVLGGDCTLLIGVFAALRERWQRPGLWFVDGHLDYYDGETSPSGETADMDLAILTGRGPLELTEIAGPAPLVNPSHVVVLGHRAAADAEGPEELEMAHPEIELIDAPTVSARGAREVGDDAERRLSSRTDAVWLHLDLDVMSTEALGAVSYPQPGGLSWEELEGLLEPIARSPALVGASVADLNADLDRDGDAAGRICELLVELLKED